MSEFLSYEVSDGVATLTIQRPEKRNAMTFAMLRDFIEMVAAASEDSEARVLIITGVPGSFCAGTDLSDLSTIPGKERGLRGTAEERSKWWPIVDCAIPVMGDRRRAK